MRRDIVVGLCLLLAGLAGQGLAAPIPEAGPASQKPGERRALPVEGVITNPDWLAKPTGEDLANYYPQVASFVGLEGRAVIHCSVTANGTLANCLVQSEAPQGLRFGEATLKLANLFRMKPMTVDGSPVSGGSINIPVNFHLPRPTADETEAEAPSAAPSPKAIAMGRRVAKIMIGNLADSWKSSAARWIPYMDQLSPEEQAALDAYGQAFVAQAQKATDEYAMLYARSYSEANLGVIANFLESDAGRAWYTQSSAVGPGLQALTKKVQQSAGEGAVAHFCEHASCPWAKVTASPSPAK